MTVSRCGLSSWSIKSFAISIGFLAHLSSTSLQTCHTSQRNCIIFCHLSSRALRNGILTFLESIEKYFSTSLFQLPKKSKQKISKYISENVVQGALYFTSGLCKGCRATYEQKFLPFFLFVCISSVLSSF